MTKTTHIRRRKPLMGPSSFRGEFTNTIISGSMAGRHGTGALPETFHVEVTAMKLGVRAQLKCHWLLKSKLFPHQDLQDGLGINSWYGLYGSLSLSSEFIFCRGLKLCTPEFHVFECLSPQLV